MAQLRAVTPTWLGSGTIGGRIFSKVNPNLADDQSQQGLQDEDRPMAVRENELFVVVNNSIRWTSLSREKELWENVGKLASSERIGYKTLKYKSHERIQHLVMSPNQELMAVVTEHNVTVVLLPDLSSLRNEDETSIRVKTHTIGPTTHVTSQSSLAKVLWHPLGVDGNCLVTITSSAVVRLWELDRRTLSSFSEPSIAIDLKKLRYAKSQEQHVGAGDMMVNRTFSADVEMEITAACFGANPLEAQSFEWSAATLWLAMAEGDIFALCPLLPTKFQPDDDGTIPTLLGLKHAEKQSLDAADSFNPEKAQVQAQCAWLEELQGQYDDFERYDGALVPPRRIYTCPKSQGVVPRLQGPFVILPDEVQDELVPCDIHVIGATSAVGFVDLGDTASDSEDTSRGISFSTVGILSTDGRVHICVDVDGVEPQWLPKKRSPGQAQAQVRPTELLLLEVLDTIRPEDAFQGRPPVITSNTSADEYSFFVTTANGIYQLSVEPWIHHLEAEIQASGIEGVQLRTQVLSQGPGSSRERILRFSHVDNSSAFATPVIISTQELGHMLFTVHGEHTQAVVFTDPEAEEEPLPLTWKPASGQSVHLQPSTPEAKRDIYSPPQAFSAPSGMASFLDNRIDPRYKRLLKDEIRLSSATLSVMTEAHRILSKETTALNDAAGDLFRRCDRLHDEFRHQIQKVLEVADRIKQVNDTDGDPGQKEQDFNATGRKKAVEERVQNARERQEKLMRRHDELRTKLAHAGGKPLSNKERVWAVQVRKTQESVGEERDPNETDTASRETLLNRFEQVRRLAEELLRQVADTKAGGMAELANGQGKIPPDIRKNRMAQVQELLNRETALVDTAIDKLSSLGISTQAQC